ncbi:MAG: alpha/beta hydrolase [Planctomycetota bacterium]
MRIGARAMRLAVVLLAAAWVAPLQACGGPIEARTVSEAAAFDRDLSSIATGGGLSEHARRTLSMWTGETIRRKPPSVETLLALRADLLASPDQPLARDRTAALAESLLYYATRRRPRAGEDATIALACAELAWRELELAASRDEAMLSGITRRSMDVYNRALTRLVALGAIEPAEAELGRVFEGAGGTYALEFAEGEHTWNVADFERVSAARRIEVKGLRHHHRREGLGTPLVLERDNTPARAAVDPNLPPEGIVYPGTLTLAFDARDGSELVSVTGLLHDTLRTRTTNVLGRRTPIASDQTASIGVLHARTDLHELGKKGSLDPRAIEARTGLYMLEPYREDKIPLILVHGLRSSPLTWRNVLNELRGDDIIRRRYQIWMFVYPTALPIPRSALELRRALADVRERYDPYDTSWGMDRSVIVGHSMGGIITASLVRDVGERLYASIYLEPLDDLDLSDNTRGLMREIFYYPPDRKVKRIVLVAAPHRGAEMADGFIGRLGRAFSRLSDDLRDARRELLANRDAMDPWMQRNGVPTGIATLSPQAPSLRGYLESPFVDWVTVHTIMGDRGKPRADEPGDGIVPNASSRLESAVSEVIVPSGHNAHDHPAAIAEMRRILLLHLQSEDPSLELSIDTAPEAAQIAGQPAEAVDGGAPEAEAATPPAGARPDASAGG